MAKEYEHDSGDISEWRSIVTLIVFVITNLIVLFPFHIPFFIPRRIHHGFFNALVKLRIIPPRLDRSDSSAKSFITKHFVRFNIPCNFITAPLVADLFLLAISAIGRKEVHDGTLGTDNIDPLDIMIFFITLAYIAISIDASGLIRWLAFKVLLWGGKVGHRLFFYLYAFFFGLGTFIGNDPIILSGTAFLAYMTRVSKNIRHPKAWIYSQFAIANIASAILVSSNPTNLVLAGAFQIKFIKYTANMVVPVVVTAIILFPFLLYIVFPHQDLIPSSIEMHALPNESRNRPPVNPNIPHARGHHDQAEDGSDNEEAKILSLEEIMNPFLDRKGAAFGATIMAATLVTVLALNAASQSSGEHPVFWVTLPAAVVMFCWDVTLGWLGRKQTREIARSGRRKMEDARAERERIQGQSRLNEGLAVANGETGLPPPATQEGIPLEKVGTDKQNALGINSNAPSPIPKVLVSSDSPQLLSKTATDASPTNDTLTKDQYQAWATEKGTVDAKRRVSTSNFSNLPQANQENPAVDSRMNQPKRATVVSLCADMFLWCQETFPTVSAVIMHLPFALVPFAFTMFVLVQALVTKGWVRVFAHGWDHWVDKTGTVGAIGGMGFLSVVLSNFAGTNIGTTILLSRVIQQWEQIHRDNQLPITDRTFWATVYSMALGVNYGAFSTAFSASLAGLLWRDILARKHIKVHSLDFARVNFPIIAISMTVGCTVLVGQVYITRNNGPYSLS